MKYEYWIEHNNGVKGQHGFSDGVATTEEFTNILTSMENMGIIVYAAHIGAVPVTE